VRSGKVSTLGADHASADWDSGATRGFDSEGESTTVLTPAETGFMTAGGVPVSRAVRVPSPGRTVGGFFNASRLISLAVLGRNVFVVATPGSVCSSGSVTTLGSVRSDFTTAGGYGDV
jgi:hypothetical protein